MNETESALDLTGLELAGADVSVVYRAGKAGDQIHQPRAVRIARDGMFVYWDDPPASLSRVRVEWLDAPFTPGPYRGDCRVENVQPDGLAVRFDDPAPGLSEWFGRVAGLLSRRAPDAAVKTSKLYTWATVVSATGLFSGALAILLPILAGDQPWVDLAAKVLLMLMVLSIGGFAWLRALAGRAEVRAIAQSR